jgi:hypothetical protein
MSACFTTPTPALPRKRERERTSRLSSLSRLRGRVARSSERDARVRAWLQTYAEAA